MAHLTLPSGTLELIDEGPGDGAPIVLVHGYSVNARLWDPVVPPLLAAGCRVVRPTLPIGAHTLRAGCPVSFDTTVAMVAELLDVLELQDVTLVGNDSGGAICQLVADRRPERLGRLVLTNCDTAGNFPPFPFDLLFLRLSRTPRLLHLTLRLGRRTRLTHWLFGLLTATGLPRGQVDAWIAPYLDDQGVRAETDAWLRSIDPAALDEADTRKPMFDKPAHFIWGSADRFFTLEHARRTAALFPRAEVVEVAGAKTFVMLDAPDRVAEEVLRVVHGGRQNATSTTT